MKIAIWYRALALPLILVAASCSGNDDSSSINISQNDQGSGLGDGGNAGPQEGRPTDPNYTPPAKPAGCVESTRLTAQCSGGFCNIPAGCFLMGSPPWDSCRGPDEVPHWVTLTRSFSMGETEVTRAQFRSLMGNDPVGQVACADNCPVEDLTWHQAAAYANALSASQGLAPCYTCTGVQEAVSCQTAAAFNSSGAQTIYDCPGYRLPTEAEWEYAYRAGTTTTYYNGDEESCYNADTRADAIAWTSLNANNTPHPVGLKLPNSWGLLDMGGNVEEWVHDGYLPYPQEGVTDPIQQLPGPESYSARGGSWKVYPADIRAADRNEFAATESAARLGMRMVRSGSSTVP